MPLDFAFARPCENGVRGELRPMIGDDHARRATPPDERQQLAGDALARDRRVGKARALCLSQGWARLSGATVRRDGVLRFTPSLTLGCYVLLGGSGLKEPYGSDSLALSI
jgi:hypothetical protein